MISLARRSHSAERFLSLSVFALLVQSDAMFCAQDGRDGAVAAAESGRPGADRCGHGGHHEGLQGKVPSNEGLPLPRIN